METEEIFDMEGGDKSPFTDQTRIRLNRRYSEEAYGLWIDGHDAENASQRIEIDEVNDEQKLSFLEDLFADFDRTSLSG